MKKKIITHVSFISTVQYQCLGLRLSFCNPVPRLQSAMVSNFSQQSLLSLLQPSCSWDIQKNSQWPICKNKNRSSIKVYNALYKITICHFFLSHKSILFRGAPNRTPKNEMYFPNPDPSLFVQIRILPNKVRFCDFFLSLCFLSLTNDVNVPSKSK